MIAVGFTRAVSIGGSALVSVVDHLPAFNLGVASQVPLKAQFEQEKVTVLATHSSAQQNG